MLHTTYMSLDSTMQLYMYIVMLMTTFLHMVMLCNKNGNEIIICHHIKLNYLNYCTDRLLSHYWCHGIIHVY